ncbi:MAG: DegT/DnrJ/EryC1/StrS family aminotransferase, partial [Desulfarculaceae bacterium]
PGISFRRVPDEAGDSATFISWFMPDAVQTQRLADLLAEHEAPCIPWGRNTWHNYEHWEHLQQGSTVAKGGWPFIRAEGTASYPADALPQTKAILDRCLSWQIMLAWDEAKLKQMTEAINAAVGAW